MKNFLAIDIGGTFVKYGVVSENAVITHLNKIKTPETLQSLLDLIEHLSQTSSNISGIAVSCPGAVSDDGIIYGSSAVPYIHGPNMKQLIGETTGLHVYLENDANCAGYAEIWDGNGKGKNDVLVMVIGTGIGGAIFKNGSLHKGANLHGGEFGYMLLNHNISNSDDVWSRLASTKALVKKVAALKQIDSNTLSGEQVFELAESGDVEVAKIVEDFYHLLAVGIYNLQYIYDPEVILIGGGISQREDLIEKITQKLDLIIEKIDLAKIKPSIARCKFAQDANLLGAVYGYLKSNEIKMHRR
ncbi:ROK family protein [Terribacillus saccharophilus]|uniref:ROK family protein n=1 Tax=Terribacillus saccharophilus TaxID=361277 RepID=UPI0037F23E04